MSIYEEVFGGGMFTAGSGLSPARASRWQSDPDLYRPIRPKFRMERGALFAREKYQRTKHSLFQINQAAFMRTLTRYGFTVQEAQQAAEAVLIPWMNRTFIHFNHASATPDRLVKQLAGLILVAERFDTGEPRFSLYQPETKPRPITEAGVVIDLGEVAAEMLLRMIRASDGAFDPETPIELKEHGGSA